MATAMSALEFSIMAFAFSVRDLFVRPEKILSEAEIHRGDVILDYGCGTGSFSLAAADKVGSAGMVYALDILPLAVKRIDAVIRRKKRSNIQTICSACVTGLQDNSLDAILFFDTFHMCNNKESLLREFSRVLKDDGILYFSDHHMKEKTIIAEMTSTGLFSLSRKGRKLYAFFKKNSSGFSMTPSMKTTPRIT